MKTFPTARGELTVQPDRSGHYTFKVYQISDANYKKVDLTGSAIELDVHPPPSADFVGSAQSGRAKKSINSCSGSNVDIDVELRVRFFHTNDKAKAHDGCVAHRVRRHGISKCK